MKIIREDEAWFLCGLAGIKQPKPGLGRILDGRIIFHDFGGTWYIFDSMADAEQWAKTMTGAELRNA